MKKLVLILITFLFFGFYTQSQNFHFGAKGGINFAKITGKDAEPLNGKTGFNAGLVAQVEFLEKFGLQPELIYSTQGGKDADGDDFTMDYLNLPILIDYKLIKNLSLQIGPQFGLKVRKGKSFTELNNFDFSGAFGVQVSFSKFFAQARYSLGFTKLFEQTDAKNGVFQLSVGYWFF